MKPLAKSIPAEDRTLKQIQRQGAVALYKLIGETGQLYGYEVVRIRKLPAQTIFDKEYPEREAYPTSEQWGYLGWSFPAASWGKTAAVKAFQHLLEKYGITYPGDREDGAEQARIDLESGV